MSQESVAIHITHGPWKQVGRCVYCACGARIYSGRIPRTNDERDRLVAALDQLIEYLAKR